MMLNQLQEREKYIQYSFCLEDVKEEKFQDAKQIQKHIYQFYPFFKLNYFPIIESKTRLIYKHIHTTTCLMEIE